LNKDGAEAAAKALNDAGIKVEYDVRAAQGESDEQGQLALLNDMANKGYDGIVVSPISDGNLLPGVEKGKDKGIPFVINNDTFMPEIDSFCGASHWKAGTIAAEYISKKLNGEGQVAIIQGLPKSEPARERTNAFKDWMTKNSPGIQIVDVQNADWDRLKAREITDIWMKKYPDLKAIFANNDTMVMGALEGVKKAGKIEKCLLVGVDGTKEAYDSIKKGELTATIDNFPFYMSQISTEMLIRKLGGQTVPKVVYTPGIVVDKDNCNIPPEKLIGWTGFNFAK
jgi:ribose transport system substrate-binding protein